MEALAGTGTGSLLGSIKLRVACLLERVLVLVWHLEFCPILDLLSEAVKNSSRSKEKQRYACFSTATGM